MFYDLTMGFTEFFRQGVPITVLGFMAKNHTKRSTMLIVILEQLNLAFVFVP